MSNRINVVFLTDTGYLLPTYVTVKSLVEHANSSYQYYIYIISNNDDVEKAWNSRKLEKRENINIKFVVPNITIPQSISAHHYVSKTALYKFWFAEILRDTDKVLYLDGDILVKSDLWNLYSTDIEEYYAAVVKDMPMYHGDRLVKRGLSEYFNSGMMLLNTRLLRENDIANKLLKAKISIKNSDFMDQDAFNMVLGVKVKYISPIYNYIDKDMEECTIEEFAKFYGVELSELSNVEIDHLSGEKKPWNTTRAHGFQEWTSYLDNSEDLGRCLTTSVKTDMDYLYNQISGINEHVEKLYAADEALNEHVKRLYAANDELNQHIQSLYTANDELNQHIQTLISDNENLNKHIQILYTTNEKLDDKFEKELKKHSDQIEYLSLPLYKRIIRKLFDRK